MIISNRPSLNLQALNADIENNHDDNWVISYLDVFVLISTVFVVLLVLSHPEKEENVTQTPTVSTHLSPADIVDVSDLALARETAPKLIQSNAQWLNSIALLIKSNGLASHVELIKEPDFTELTIQSRVLFSAGSSHLTRSGEDLLEKLLPALKNSKGLVFIEGHTDDYPIATSQFSSNWEFASARAAQVKLFFMAEGIKKSRFRAVSYGDTKPQVTNSSEANRQKNRRISLVIPISQ